MKRATVTIPDDLEAAVAEYVRDHEAAPSLTTVVQTALRQYLADRGYIAKAKYLRITPARRGSGRGDISRNHDKYFAGR
jgi:hypothetical protein